MSEKSCLCAPFDRDSWEGREVVWRSKAFFRQKMGLLFGEPIDIPRTIRRALARIRRAELPLADPYMVCERHRNPFQGDLLVAVAPPDPPRDDVVKISGRFLAHVYRGPYSQLGRARKAFVERIRIEQGIKPAEVLYWYANCPKCWEAAGGPATVILARVGAGDAPPPPAAPSSG